MGRNCDETRHGDAPALPLLEGKRRKDFAKKKKKIELLSGAHTFGVLCGSLLLPSASPKDLILFPTGVFCRAYLGGGGEDEHYSTR